ncbi:MAG: ribonucleoside-diphosphate reductase subunit alpha [Verrucomicrobiae bacterium]|nr:ribonucleoside-diphosphate reductase subunit alpha [Verrucomicrobiae bacterium]
MIGKNFIEEDLELKRLVESSPKDRPRFDWANVARNGLTNRTAGEGLMPAPEVTDDVRITVEVNGEQRNMETSDIADMIGEAVTDLMLSRQEDAIFTDKNQSLVTEIARVVSLELNARHTDSEGDAATLSAREVGRIIERALVRRNAHDVAKSFILRHHRSDFGKSGGGLGETPVSVRARVIRRNGQVVKWKHDKIEIAVRKAFLSLQMDSSPAEEIANAVTQRVHELEKDFIHIEELQDLVQVELMRSGHYKIAEAYIIYRAHRKEQREQIEKEAERQSSSVQQDAMILLTMNDGETWLWDGLDLKKRIAFASMGLDLCLNHEEIESELRRSLFPEMKVEDLKKTIILNAKSMIERDADFTKFAGRILLSYIYEEVLDWNIVTDGIDQLPAFHRKAFKRHLVRSADIKRVNPRLLDLELDKLAEALDPAADMDFDYLGIQTMYDRYLIVDKHVQPHKRLEAPQLFWMRVAMGIFIDETTDQTERIIALYNLYKGRRFCSSTPTLFNSGTNHSQLSSCYLYQVGDSIESIMQRGIAENAYLSKWAGGLGGSWTAVRGTGSYIHGTNGESQGVIPFLKLHNDQLVAVNQGGKRRGSGCAYLETWHADIQDFLELRKNTGDERRRTHDMNTANWVPDLFMKRMEGRQDWTLFRSNETPDLHELYGSAFEKRYVEYEKMAEDGEIHGRKIPAIDLWKQMLKMIFETGHPWITFKDPCNVRSPQDHVGVIHSSNLCTEITLNTGPDETAVCNLGSIVLDSHIDAKGNIDHDKLRQSVRIAVRALDNVIDINFYPTDAARRSNLRHRPIGLGVMGLQNALYMKGVPFASQEAVEFNDEFMEAIAYYAYEASSDLAAERGTYSTYKGSKWDRGMMPQDTVDLLERERGQTIEVERGGKMDWAPLREKIAKQGMRNSNVLAIAPTATISNIMGSTPCIEPSYKNLFVKSNLSGEFIMLNSFLVRDLKKLDLWSSEMLNKIKYYDGELAEIEEIPEEVKQRYTTAFDIDFNWFIKAAARRQKWIDQSQSVNLFLKHTDMKTLSHMYRAAWRSGLKTTYYLRTMGASNIEKATVSVKKEVRGHAGSNGNNGATREYTEEERTTCSIEAMMNGGTCEACQ